VSTDEPPFSRVAIVGLGLIGGSIALGIRERWPSVRIVGVDRQPVLAHALGGGAIDRAAVGVGEIGEPDLVILAAPVRQNVALLGELTRTDVGGGFSRPGDSDVGAAFRRPAFITDVGGTKRDIVEAAKSLPPDVVFIGGHPIGGAERGGFGFARPDLFRGRPWIFTPAQNVAIDHVRRLSRFVEGLGARPHMLGAEEHDRLMAVLSHVPQLAATALMDVVGDGATAEGLRLAGRGLVDTTRLASSPASVWRDICSNNADEIGPALDALITRLSEMRRDLERGEAMDGVFDRAARWRAELMHGRE
jgi:prephenate dehydrogenase